jgi:hypothetical protein
MSIDMAVAPAQRNVTNGGQHIPNQIFPQAPLLAEKEKSTEISAEFSGWARWDGSSRDAPRASASFSASEMPKLPFCPAR